MAPHAETSGQCAIKGVRKWRAQAVALYHMVTGRTSTPSVRAPKGFTGHGYTWLVRHALHLYASGKSYLKIAEILNAQHLPSPGLGTGHQESRKGWASSAVR